MTAIHKRRSPARTGYSLLELVAVVVILGVIAVIVVPRLGFTGHYAKSNVCKQYKADLDTAMEKYQIDHGTFPNDLSLLENSDYYPEAIPICPVTNAPYTIDGASNRIAGHNH